MANCATLRGTTTGNAVQQGATQADANNREIVSASKPLSQLLANRQWWKVCWVYGDQTKFYRQLYGHRKTLNTLRDNRQLPAPCHEPDDDL